MRPGGGSKQRTSGGARIATYFHDREHDLVEVHSDT
jgi:hypothetical protein